MSPGPASYLALKFKLGASLRDETSLQVTVTSGEAMVAAQTINVVGIEFGESLVMPVPSDLAGPITVTVSADKPLQLTDVIGLTQLHSSLL